MRRFRRWKSKYEATEAERSLVWMRNQTETESLGWREVGCRKVSSVRDPGRAISIRTGDMKTSTSKRGSGKETVPAAM